MKCLLSGNLRKLISSFRITALETSFLNVSDAQIFQNPGTDDKFYMPEEPHNISSVMGAHNC